MEPFVLDGFMVERELGTGATGSVYLATAPGGQKVALKVLVKDSSNPRYGKLHENMMVESNALQQLDHPHIMKILGAKMDQSWQQYGQHMEGDYLASELLCNGELFDFIDCERGAF